jgi:iron complex transport system substrate-binding protein
VRIVSLLPSASEIIVRLGLADSLVGRSNECTYPPEVQHLPVVTAARIDPRELESVEIDQQVREAIADGRSLYAVDAALIDRLAPDVIVTQDLCAVCAVSSGELASACPVGATVISLDPSTLDQVAFEDHGPNTHRGDQQRPSKHRVRGPSARDASRRRSPETRPTRASP